MKSFSVSYKLIDNTRVFLNIHHHTFFDGLFRRCGTFYGWGRKHSGQKAVELSQKHDTSFVLLEDGFIRSLGLGVDGSPSFSIIEDDVGIYYDATAPSRLENILNTYDFASDVALIATAREAMYLIRHHHISKYNHASDLPEGFFESELDLPQGHHARLRGRSARRVNDEEMTKRVLIVAQTAGDASLSYGMGNQFTTDQMIDAAIAENPDATVYLKIHPDVLCGKKSSDIDIERARQKCIIIEENIDPISLLEHFDIVYTKTSQMGFEALILGKKCVCFGMPFYAGWGITDDRVSSERCNRQVTVEEVFAAAYILYTRYYNPYQKRSSDIIDTIHEIVRQRRMRQNRPPKDKTIRILAIGDSHIRVFEHSYFGRFFPNIAFKIIYVPGATASGIRNVNSLTQAYSIFKAALEEGGYDEIFVTLGEVDAAYAIWKRAEVRGTEIAILLEDVVAKYEEFIHSLCNYAPTTVISAPLQTISDCRGCGDETSKVRSSIDISIVERTRLTLDFNKKIKMFCAQQKIDYFDFDTIALGKEGMVRSWLVHPDNPCDHHYRRWVYAMLIIGKLMMRKFFK